MDIHIVLLACFSFVLFIFLHIIVFRTIRDNEIMKWLLRIYGSTAIIHAVIASVAYTVFIPSRSTLGFIEYTGLSFFLYSLLTFSFVLAVFGITITSLRIQLVSMIAQSRSRGVSIQKIVKTYNRDTIVKTRLSRLLGSGEIYYRNGQYYPTKLLTYFKLHTYFLLCINRLYKKQVYKL